MNETSVQSKKTTKICLKCGRGLRSNHEKCGSCGCKDTMNKEEYNKLIDEYERADNNKKTQIRNNPNYELFFKYKYIQQKKDLPKNKCNNREDLYDTFKSIGGLITLIVGIILWIYVTINSSVIMGFIIFAFFVWLGYTIINSVSDKTKQEVVEINKAKEEQKKHQELHGGYKCPNCGKNAGHEITIIKKSASIGVFGLASNKIGKNYECKNCGYKW